MAATLPLRALALLFCCRSSSLIDTAELPPQALRPRYNAAPTQELPVILDSEPHKIQMAHWGYPIRVAGHEKELINSRCESFAEKPFFQNVVLSHRCLVLADSFFEWQRVRGGKQPYRIPDFTDQLK